MTTSSEALPHTRSVLAAVTVGMLTVVGWLAVVVSIILGAQVVTGDLSAEVPVRLGGGAPAYTEDVLPCVEGASGDSTGCAPATSPDVWPGGGALPVQHAGGLVVSSRDAGPLAALLATVATWGGVLTAGVSLLVLLPVFRSTASGRPFEPGNGRRLSVAAALVASTWALSVVGTALAAPMIIRAVESTTLYSADAPFDMPAGWLELDLGVPWWPAVFVLLLVALAVATSRGTRLATDTEGLV